MNTRPISTVIKITFLRKTNFAQISILSLLIQKDLISGESKTGRKEGVVRTCFSAPMPKIYKTLKNRKNLLLYENITLLDQLIRQLI